MIGYLTGTVLPGGINSRELTLLTVGGVGYRVFVANSEQFAPNDPLSLYITTVVREDCLDLYGFLTSDERELFETLTSVSGVGPRTALGILATTTPGTLADAIATKNIAFLTTLSGIGKKTAEKICLDLSDKIKKLSFEPTRNVIHDDLADALLSMGYQSRDIVLVLTEYTFNETTLQGRIREALSELQKRNK